MRTRCSTDKHILSGNLQFTQFAYQSKTIHEAFYSCWIGPDKKYYCWLSIFCVIFSSSGRIHQTMIYFGSDTHICHSNMENEQFFILRCSVSNYSPIQLDTIENLVMNIFCGPCVIYLCESCLLFKVLAKFAQV